MTTPEIPGLAIRPMVIADRALREEAALNIGDHSMSLDYVNFVPARGDYGVVAEIEGTPAGVAWASFVECAGLPDTVGIPDFRQSVNSDYRGMGLGTTLLNAIISYGREVGWPGISLHVDEDNEARRLYARLGFESQDQPGTMLLHLHPRLQRVAVYCGSSVGIRSEYEDAAEHVGKELAARGIELVYGGGNIGLMGMIADSVLDAGGQVTGVIPRALVDREIAHPNLTNLEVVADMAARKTRMEKLADAFIALPGGAGTLEEVFEVFTLQQLGQITGPLVLFDVENFWAPLVETLRRMSEEGFIQAKFVDALIVVDEVEEMFEALEVWRYPGWKWS